MKPLILCIVGARPNFIKMSAIFPALKACQEYFRVKLVHTGQHYDHELSQVFFDGLNLPNPDIGLEITSGTQTEMIAQIAIKFESIVIEEKPAAVLVVGDVNSTLACSLVASRYPCKLIHVEAGLRSFDRSMPEETNRILTDQLSDLLFVTEQSGMSNLENEGISQDKVHLVGNVMIDTLKEHIGKLPEISSRMSLHGFPSHIQKDNYILCTLHRPANVDDVIRLKALMNSLIEIQKKIPILFIVHPRTLAQLQKNNLMSVLEDANIVLGRPLPYCEMLAFMQSAKCLLTDSGGIQEEATILKTPCITLRENTERPITLSCNNHYLVGHDNAKIQEAVGQVLAGKLKICESPPLWDGHAAKRIAKHVIDAMVKWEQHEEFSKANRQCAKH